jgi:NDP-sugar pyrophosphorylase family protein
MRAIILAGGKGVRLAPLTEVIPKPLVPIGGMPVMEIVIRQLQKHGFRRITLAVGYMADLIKAYFQDGEKLGVSIDYSYESSPLGTVGPLSLVDNLDQTFLVMNADILSNINYLEFLDFHRRHGAIATIGAYNRQVTIDLGVIVNGEAYRIIDFLEKPSLTYIASMGIYFFEPEILKFIHGTEYLDFPDLVKRLLQSSQTVNYYPFEGYWLDIGRHDDYAEATEEFDNVRDKLKLL